MTTTRETAAMDCSPHLAARSHPYPGSLDSVPLFDRKPLLRFANHLSFCFLLKTVLYGMLYNTAYNFRGIPRLVAVVNLP